MAWDTDDAKERSKQRDRELSRYLPELAAGSSFYRRHLAACGIDPRRVHGLEDLRRLRPVGWEDVAEDPGAFLVTPGERDVARVGDRLVVLWVALGRLLRRRERVNRDVLEPLFKPVLWTLEGGVPVGSTEADLELLGEAGARVLSLAGLARHDVLVSVAAPGPDLAFWQLAAGARAAHVAALHLGPDADAEEVAAAGPDALAGGGDELLAVLAAVEEAGLALPRLHAVVVAGEDPDAGIRDALAVAASRLSDEDVAVIGMWAPRGARAMWGECRDGAGYHTFPDLEVLEVARSGALHRLGEGELLWSALGWRGTAVLRLRTGAVGELTEGTCDACGRSGPMVVTGSRGLEAVVRLLEAREEVAAFALEVRAVDGVDELLVFVALRRGVDAAALVGDLDGWLVATQYVVVPRRSVDAKARRAGSRVVDARPS